MKLLELGPVTVVGHSLGGAIAETWGLTAPFWFAAIGWFLFQAVQAALLRVVLERAVGDLTLPDAVAVVAAANPPT